MSTNSIHDLVVPTRTGRGCWLLLEPDLRIELRTYRLQGGCSTTELIRLGAYLSSCCLLSVLSGETFGEGVDGFLWPLNTFLNFASDI